GVRHRSGATGRNAFLKIPKLFPWHDPARSLRRAKSPVRRDGQSQSRMVDLPNWLARYGFPRERATKARDSCTVTLTAFSTSLSRRFCSDIPSTIVLSFGTT